MQKNHKMFSKVCYLLSSLTIQNQPTSHDNKETAWRAKCFQAKNLYGFYHSNR